jgi:hypothetical protein
MVFWAVHYPFPTGEVNMPKQTLALTLIAGLSPVSVPATADVLDLGSTAPAPTLCASSPEGLRSATQCGEYGYVLQSYGDVAGVVDVAYSAPKYPGQSLRWWDTNYNDPYGVLWATGSDTDSTAHIDITSLQAGRGSALTHFDVGAYSNSTRTTSITITDLANNGVRYSCGGGVGMAGNQNVATPFDFDQPLFSAKGIGIEWKDSACNVGIDNIT